MLKILSFQKSIDTDIRMCLYIGIFFQKKSLKSRFFFWVMIWSWRNTVWLLIMPFRRAVWVLLFYPLALTEMFRNNIFLSTFKNGHCLAKACFVQHFVCCVTLMYLVMVTWVFLISLSLKNLSTLEEEIILKHDTFRNLYLPLGDFYI